MWRELTIISKINKNKPIGFFDSGVGGLTVFSEFRKVLPFEDCIYFGDTKNMPYGEKSKEQLLEFSRRAFDFFQSQNVKAVVMACNTTSAIVYDELKNIYPFKTYPVIQSVTKLISELPVSKIGVFATPATINSHAYSKGIKMFAPEKEVFEIACPEWVKIVESHQESTPSAMEEIKIKMDDMLRHNPDKIVLGCTHYPFLIKQLSCFAEESLFINPAKYYVDFLKEDMCAHNMLSDKQVRGAEEFYCSANCEKFKTAAGMFYNIETADIKLLT